MIEELKMRLNIKDLVMQFGIKIYRNDFIKSIYKDEKHPSLKLYEKTNSYYDFSTGKGGDVIDFYAAFKNIEMKQAIRELCDAEGITKAEIMPNNKKSYVKQEEWHSFRLLKEEEETFEEKAGYIEYMEGCDRNLAEQIAMKLILYDRIQYQKLIFEELEKYCNGIDEECYKYLTGPERGLNAEIIKKAKLFSIKNVNNTVRFLLRNFSKDQLRIAGLFNEKGNFVFSYHKLIIPYIKNGEIVYLRGRKMNNNDERFKYIGLSNFAENLTARRLYNEDILKELNKGNELLLCEGEFDTLRSLQEGIPAAGIPGVNNFPNDISEQLREFNLYLALDNDEAGDNGVKKIAQIIGRKINVIKLIKHKDLTEYFNDR